MADSDDALPEYCPFYKPLLVEHFTLLDESHRLHYGKCSLLGRTVRDPSTLEIYLGSTRLIGLPLEFQCPDNRTRVRLQCNGIALRADETVRLFGEAMLIDRLADDKALPLSSKELAGRAERNGADARQRYEPCLSLHSVQLIDQPHELLQLQLRLDQITARFDA